MKHFVVGSVTIPPNTQARVLFDPLFAGAQCQTLMEGGKVIWSSENRQTSVEGFAIEKDSTTGLMTVHIRSGEYVFQALWK